ncbi:MAG: hypothetical protein PVF58_18235 [Candidatus Methanofastidiosia archaeon]
MANQQKSIGTILSEALDVISGNPMIIVPYLIPVILALISAFVTIGAFIRGGALPAMATGMEVDPQFFLSTALTFMGIGSVIGVLAWIFTIVANAFAITITNDHLQGRKVTLQQAWQEIGVDKIIILIIVSIIVAILTILGFFVFCIGALIVLILMAFVGQGVVIDSLGIGATLSKSYNVAKKNWVDVFIVLLVVLVAIIILNLIPVIGGFLQILAWMYSVVAFTILYQDRK